MVERLGKWKELYKKDLNKIKSVKTGNEELIGIKKSYTQSILLTMTMSMINDEWKESEPYCKFMSKDIEFIKKSVHRMFIKKRIYDLRFFFYIFFWGFFFIEFI